MQARGDSFECLANGSCEPLGGYSVWTTLPPPPLEDSVTATAAWEAMPTVLVLGKLDAQVTASTSTSTLPAPRSLLIHLSPSSLQPPPSALLTVALVLATTVIAALE